MPRGAGGETPVARQQGGRGAQQLVRGNAGRRSPTIPKRSRTPASPTTAAPQSSTTARSPMCALVSRSSRSKTTIAPCKFSPSIRPPITIAAILLVALGQLNEAHQGFRPRDPAGARIRRRLFEPRQRPHQARPTRRSDSRFHQGHRIDASQRAATVGPRPRALGNRQAARRHPRFLARGQCRRALCVRLSQSCGSPPQCRPER